MLIEEEKRLLALTDISDLMMAVKALPRNIADVNTFLLTKAAPLRLKLSKGFTDVGRVDPPEG